MTPKAKTVETGPIGFLRRRLSPKGYLGLHLTIGMLILIAACAVFAEITEDVVTGDTELQVDVTVAQYFNARQTPTMNAAMKAISFVGSAAFLGPLTALIGLYLGWRHYWYRLLMLGFAVPGGVLLNIAVKNVIHRARPVLENPIVTLTSYSFPSGHTTGAILFYGLMAVFALSYSKRTVLRTCAVAGASIVILLVGFSRIYLGAHFLSDVLGALAAGAAWLAFCVTAVETYRRRKEHRREARSSLAAIVR
jgi:membrane-associated phospholipid phosphatase